MGNRSGYFLLGDEDGFHASGWDDIELVERLGCLDLRVVSRGAVFSCYDPGADTPRCGRGAAFTAD